MSTTHEASAVPGENTTPTTASRRRRRPAVVCTECRRRKIACDRKLPCTQCVLAHASCAYQGQGPISKSSRTEELLSEEATAASSSAYATYQIPTEATDSEAITLDNTPAPRASSALEITTAENSDEQLKANVDVPSQFNKTRLLGKSHWMHGFDQFDDIVGNDLSKFLGQDSGPAHLLDDCKKIARALKRRRPLFGISSTIIREMIPEEEICDCLIENYFRTFEKIFRILHKPSFYDCYRKFRDSPEKGEDGFLVTLLLVLSIGTCFQEDIRRSNSLHYQASEWIYVAQSWFKSDPFNKHRLTISSIQAQCLLLVAIQTNAVGGELTWVAIGSLLHASMIMGLHRDPLYLRKMPIFQAEMRRRLWATIVELIAQSSLSLGMPSPVSPEGFDSRPPMNIDDDQLKQDNVWYIEGEADDRYTDCSIQRALFASLPLRLRIVKELNDLQPGPSYYSVLEIGKSLMDHCRSNSKLFNQLLKTKTTGHSAPTFFPVRFLDLLTRRFLLSLHLLFARKSKTDVLFYYSRVISVECALLIMSPYSHSDIETTQNDLDCWRFEQLSRGIFKSLNMEAWAMICGELIDRVKETTAPAIEHILSTELYRAVEKARDFSLARIQASETNVKTFVFMECVLAKVGAICNESPIESAVKTSAESSLEIAHRILKTKFENVTLSRSNSNTPADVRDDCIWMGSDFTEGGWRVDLDMNEDWLFSRWDNDRTM